MRCYIESKISLARAGPECRTNERASVHKSYYKTYNTKKTYIWTKKNVIKKNYKKIDKNYSILDY